MLDGNSRNCCFEICIIFMNALDNRRYTYTFLETTLYFSSMRKEDTFQLPRGGGILPIMTYTERLHPKGVPFSGFKVGISQVEVYGSQRVGKSVIWVF